MHYYSAFIFRFGSFYLFLFSLFEQSFGIWDVLDCISALKFCRFGRIR